MIVSAILSLQLITGQWIEQERMTYNECLWHAEQLASVAMQIQAEGGYISIDKDGIDNIVIGVRCTPVEEPTS